MSNFLHAPCFTRSEAVHCILVPIIQISSSCQRCRSASQSTSASLLTLSIAAPFESDICNTSYMCNHIGVKSMVCQHLLNCRRLTARCAPAPQSAASICLYQPLGLAGDLQTVTSIALCQSLSKLQICTRPCCEGPQSC